MRGLVSLLILINAFFAVSATEDRFIFDVSFQCGYTQREKYSYNVQFLERDHWMMNSNDPITGHKINFARPGYTHFTMSGSQSGDEHGSEGYEVSLELYHNCNEYQTEEYVVLFIEPNCKIGHGGTCHYTIFKDIKDLKGEHINQATLKYE